MRVVAAAEVDAALDFPALIEALAEGADAYPLELCSRGQLVVLVHSLAKLMRSYLTGEDSSGSASTDGQSGTPSTSTTAKESEA